MFGYCPKCKIRTALVLVPILPREFFLETDTFLACPDCSYDYKKLIPKEKQDVNFYFKLAKEFFSL